MNPSRKAVFFGEFARLSGAGIPVDKGLKLLLRHAPNAPLRDALKGMDAALRNGSTIAEAMAPALSPLETGVIRAAENGGQIAAGFAHLEKWYSSQAKARDAALHALAYPLLIAHAAAVIPAVVGGITSGSGVLQPLLLNLGGLWFILVSLYALSRFILGAARKIPSLDAIISAVPWLGPAWRNSGLARWAAVMHFHIMSGQLLSGAFAEAGTASQRPRLNAASQRLSALTASGQPAGPAMIHEPVFPEAVALHFASAEEAGMLDTECAGLADRALHDATVSMQRAGEWLPRIIYIAAMIFAAWQVLNMGRGVFQQQQDFLRDIGF